MKSPCDRADLGPQAVALAIGISHSQAFRAGTSRAARDEKEAEFADWLRAHLAGAEPD